MSQLSKKNQENHPSKTSSDTLSQLSKKNQENLPSKTSSDALIELKTQSAPSDQGDGYSKGVPMDNSSKPKQLQSGQTQGKIERISTDTHIDADDAELRRATSYLKKLRKPTGRRQR